jgi:hypothetical protein
MTDTSAPADRTRSTLALVATIATIGFNAISSVGLLNGTTPAEISNRYLTPVTPAGFTFSIWSLIYVGLLAFGIYQVFPTKDRRFQPVRTLYILSCALNCAWIYFWHHEQILICLLIIASLLCVLNLINFKLPQPETTGEYWLTRAPFSIYAGWVTVATLVNFAVLLVYLKVELSGQVWTATAVSLIAAAVCVAVFFRFRYYNLLFPLPVAWALTGIAVKQSGNTAIVVACAVGVIACLIATLSFVVNLPSHSDTRPADQ